MKKIFIAGHKGMVGSAIIRKLSSDKSIKLITRTRGELDLTSQKEVFEFFDSNDIDEVIIAAAKVGGIFANSKYPANFIYENLMIEANIIHASFINRIKKLLFFGSVCSYPKDTQQPIREDSLLTGPLEITNEPYAIAKIAGVKLCESYNNQYGVSHNIDFRAVMPTNLYGYGDNYHRDNSHVIPALIRKFHEAKVNNLEYVDIWGSGNAKREFLFIDDLAEAALYVHNLSKKDYSSITSSNVSHINIGYGDDISIRDLANLISKIIGFNGSLRFDHDKPDGAMLKMSDTSKLKSLGWSPKISLKEGIRLSYEDFRKSLNNL